jgi:hypothetical protein
MTVMRSYKEKDIKRLISKAGGRCSYRHTGEVCKRLLAENNSVIGEKAHIVAIGKKGARYDENYDDALINSYDNLMWMCPTHHTMIDKIDDVKIYTADMLLKMKNDHEEDIKKGNLSNGITLYDTVIHDYSSLSTLFEYVDINKLYSSSLDMPNRFNHEFTDLIDMVNAFQEGNGDFVLRDLYLFKLFNNMFRSTLSLMHELEKHFHIGPELVSEDPYTHYECLIKDKRNLVEAIDKTSYFICKYQENVDKFLSAIKQRYPEIFFQKVYDPDF